ncbi:MAG: LuxR family transcriptional regulator [Mycobacterium pseudokansasii]|uniref:ATP-binding protein n=1 Tax=Mycobacterium pseudokansasii TaxID=2341080 RepID=UPI0009BF9547|nr:adenylate/guanylate cyclase domain-containing protein [Mycobacterium pseudokansasii]MBY0389793.1 LuxR family transcriptional regulator [Mycobacterium pseudokansasii]VAZ97324.1 Putative HTH-type transcriptional regulator [Mycobacterium pseudokansasii]VAZ98779.1 Putative HTH-type transcriptional regulator [Mycobacterium pseudokansasii]
MSRRAEIPPLTWDELGVSELLPTGTVTLLLADVEGSTRLWETQPENMTAALARLNTTVNKAIAAHDGVRPLEQGEGDSFVAAFARASDAVACALELQRAPLAPIRLRIGIHTGEIQLRDESNYAGPTINRTARLRDLAHGGQTVLSGATEPLVVDRLPEGVWLADLGSHPLRDLPRPERVVQLCHPDLRNEFPPLRVRNIAAPNLPAQLTSFVGRQAEMAELRRLVASERLVTLTGAGGAGKTRLAVQVANQLGTEFGEGLWYIDLAPITDPDVTPVTVARALGLPDQPGRSTMDLLIRFLGERKALLLLDNCEHLLDACDSLVVTLLAACPRLTILATSREPLGVPGELSWRVPSLSVTDEAVALFTDRARHARPEFGVDNENIALVEEICRRLDGMPLAIELAAARIRALSLQQIVDGLHDRFRLLTGGARTAVRRQQTLRASVDWSHALLTEPERVLFRRLAVFAGGFDLDAAQAVAAGSEVESYQLLDQLSLLVDKSLVVADDTGDGMRYRLLETVRQYALEKLDESAETDQVRTRHRDYYTGMAAQLEAHGHWADERLLHWAQTEIDNLRAAFTWSRTTGDPDAALQLILSLRPLWLRGGRVKEALAGLSAIFADADRSAIAPAVWAGSVAQYSILASWVGIPAELGRAQEALAVARELDDPGLIARALIACGMLALYDPGLRWPYFDEAVDLVRASGDRRSLCQIFSYQATAAVLAGEPIPAIAAGEQGRDLADALGDRFFSRNCRAWMSTALMIRGDLAGAAEMVRGVIEEVEATGDLTMAVFSYVSLSEVLSFHGQADAALAAAQSALAAATMMGGYFADAVYSVFANAALARGDAAAARKAAETALEQTNPLREVFTRSVAPLPEALLACGELTAARRLADEMVAVVPGWYRLMALLARAFVALAQDEPEQAARDAHDALTIAARTQGYLRVDDTLECLARLAVSDGNHPYAARLLGAAEAIRQRMGHPRFTMYQAGYDAAVACIREALGQSDFDAFWAEGARLSTEEAIGYAQRG